MPMVQAALGSAIVGPTCKILLGSAVSNELEFCTPENASVIIGRILGDHTSRNFDHFVFVGTGPGAHLASEAALKMRETGGAWTEAYPAMELRHGPMSALSPRSLVWSLGAGPEGLGDEVARTGATWLESAEDPLVALVRVQRLAVANALAKGLDPDHPRFLSRSVILPGSA